MIETTTAGVSTRATGSATLIDISRHRNNQASTSTDDMGLGQLNIWRNSLPIGELPSGDLIEVRGIPFLLPQFDGVTPDNVRCAGQVIGCPEGGYDWLYLLVTSERRAEDFVAMHYADGSVDFECLRVSDFWHADAAFGDREAFSTEHMHYPFHVQPNLRGSVWFQRVPVSRMAPLVAIALPANVAIHVFAMTLIPTHLEAVDASTQ